MTQKPRRWWLRAAAALALAALAVSLSACTGGSGNAARKAEEATVGAAQGKYLNLVPVPNFDWPAERDRLSQIYQLRNEQGSTWTVVTAQGTGAPLWECPSKGYPIPYDTQLTNPEQRIGGDNGPVTIPQAEPNGTYTGQNSDATWVLCVRSGGQVVPVYTEQKANAFPFEVKVGPDGQITDVGGASTATIDLSGAAKKP